MFAKKKSKNLGQNQDNLTSLLVGSWANIVKSIMFNGEISYRIVKTDSVDDAAISVPDTQVDNSEDERTDPNKIFLDENKTNI